MQRLRQALRREEGATLVLVAVSMVFLLGFVGLAIDVGRVYDERRQLSRGADALVLAVATDCALGERPCDYDTAMVTGEQYADANAEDGAAAVEALELDTDEQSVWARVKTIDAVTGTDDFDMLFAWIVGIDSTTVHAEAKAVWGYPTGASALPLIFSDCEWFKRLDPGTGLPDPTEVATIFFHDGNNTEDCNAQAGQDADLDGRLPGGFGWLDTDGSCAALIYDGDWVEDDPGASPSSGCSPAEMRDLILNNEAILIPFFDDVEGLGANGRYHIAGVGAFHPTGYHFGGQYSENPPCFGDERCISGYFEAKLLEVGDLGGENRGVVIVRLVG
jgi:hypothetical protein